MTALKIFLTNAAGYIGQALMAQIHDHQFVQQISECDRVIHFDSEDLYFTQTIFQACIKAKVKRFILISSTAVYGNPASSITITEESPYLASLNPQVAMQQAAEKLVLESETGNTEVTVLQLGRVYGPGGQSETARILNQMKSALMLLARSGAGYCNPIYIDDAVSAIRCACETPNLHRQRFIISPEQPVSWHQLLSSYESILDEKALIRLPIDYLCDPQDSISLLSTPLKKRKVMQFLSAIATSLYGKPIQFPSAEEFRSLVSQPIFSNQKARDRLNFQPEISFSTGIERIHHWWHQDVR